MIPSASAFRVNSDRALSYYNSGNKEFEVDTDGDIPSMNTFRTGNTIPFQDGLETRSNITDDNGVTVYNKTNTTIGDGTTTASHQNINNEVYASQFSGNDLGTKVKNARDYLANNDIGGTIHITPKSDGTKWTWSTDLVHDVDVQGVGLDIECAENVTINYTGTGFPITVKNAWPDFSLKGGIWNCSDDAVGWLRMMDCVHCFINPRFVDFRTPNRPDRSTETGYYTHTGSVAISIEGHDVWCELNIIEGRLKADNGIDFIPASVTGGTGTDSFQSNTIRDTMFHTHANGGFGMRVRGNHQYCRYSGIRFHINADNGRGIVLEGLLGDGANTGLQGCLFSTLKFENNDSSTGEIAIQTGSNYDGFYAPLFIQPHVSGSIEKTVAGDDGAVSSADARLPRIGTADGGLNISNFRNESVKIGVSGFSTTTFKDRSLRGGVGSVPKPSGTSTIAYHNGYDGYAEGMYRSDGPNNQWVKISDNTVTMPYY